MARSSGDGGRAGTGRRVTGHVAFDVPPGTSIDQPLVVLIAG
jgi:hypothetical protein